MAIVQTLIKHGADVNAIGAGGETALMMAARNGYSTMVEELLKHGASAEITSSGCSTAESILDRSVVNLYAGDRIRALLRGASRPA